MVYVSVFMAVYLLYSILLVLTYFQMVKNNLSLVFNSMALYDIVVVLTVQLIMMKQGADINKQFD